MLDFLPYLKEKPVLIKGLVLILLIAVSLLLSMVVGIVIAIPFFGIGILEHFNELNDYSSEATIHFMKYFQVVNQIGVFILPAIMYAYLENRKPANYLKLNSRLNFAHLLTASILIIVSIPAINWLVEINEGMKLPEVFKGLENWMRDNENKTNQLTESFLNVSTFGGLVVNLIIIALLAAVGEELLFRGVILQLFVEWFKNKHLAIIISAILFSAMHIQFYGFLPRMVLGILFGYIFIWSGSLWIPIVLHFIFNGITVVAAYLYYKGLIQTDVESFGVTDNTLLVLSSFLLITLLLFAIYRMGRIKSENV
ncbi:MAG: CPBP family intramembrane metalloprotease [Bacteroidales bacterium]|nr:CPBP family intramembrane metalloprotease [Bacteroidales bacterium]